MRGVPVAVVIKAAGFLEDAGELNAAGSHVIDGRLGALPFFRHMGKDNVSSPHQQRRTESAGQSKLHYLFRVLPARLATIAINSAGSTGLET
jgi:hypothetical protein